MSKPVLKPDDVIAYVSESDMIKFIDVNNDILNRDKICDLVKEEMFNDEGRTLVTKSTYAAGKKRPEWMTVFAFSWFREFFNEHPFLPERVMFVFDS